MDIYLSSSSFSLNAVLKTFILSTSWLQSCFTSKSMLYRKQKWESEKKTFKAATKIIKNTCYKDELLTLTKKAI